MSTRLILQIAKRASDLYARFNIKVQPVYIAAEITVVHEYICPLRLEDLLNADDGNFSHDIGGIHQHLDAAGRRLNDCFWPRFAA
jgi:hypothetical protein